MCQKTGGYQRKIQKLHCASPPISQEKELQELPKGWAVARLVSKQGSRKRRGAAGSEADPRILLSFFCLSGLKPPPAMPSPPAKAAAQPVPTAWRAARQTCQALLQPQPGRGGCNAIHISSFDAPGGKDMGECGPPCSQLWAESAGRLTSKRTRASPASSPPCTGG